MKLFNHPSKPYYDFWHLAVSSHQVLAIYRSQNVTYVNTIIRIVMEFAIPILKKDCVAHKFSLMTIFSDNFAHVFDHNMVSDTHDSFLKFSEASFDE